MKITILLILIFLRRGSGLGDGGHHWNYKQQSEWPPLCHKGNKQSPIDFSKKTVTHKSFPPFLFKDYGQTAHVELENNGHTIEMRLGETSSLAYHAFPKMAGGGLKKLYRLHHFHFHWKSEHTIQGKRYPLELHMVHYAEKAVNLTTALQKAQNVAVLGVLFTLSAEDNKYIEPIVQLIDKIKVGETMTASLKADKLIPKHTDSFYRYYGSLTTPGCVEGVLWTVFTQTLTISRRQARMFESLKTLDKTTLKQNYRKIQPINERVIFLSADKHQRRRPQSNGGSTWKVVDTRFCF